MKCPRWIAFFKRGGSIAPLPPSEEGIKGASTFLGTMSRSPQAAFVSRGTLHHETVNVVFHDVDRDGSGRSARVLSRYGPPGRAMNAPLALAGLVGVVGRDDCADETPGLLEPVKGAGLLWAIPA